MDSIKHGFKDSALDQQNVLHLVSQWKKDFPNSSIFCRPYSSTGDKDEVNFLFCYQTEWQKNLLSLYGNITLLDATYRTTRYALPLYFICVRANVCYLIVGAFVIQHERTEFIQEALCLLKDCRLES
ncbi:hypothetical protein GDO86_002228 [Hymenochirus boettgeri]|uniref:ZSWIM1/3 RNaseH-like domain-containing protein n=1 Tax=Hymenochirus boettgeri TaxID=247094 RepID=A0A8T2KM04_9PIPI|nr:hypothetical protein GDO86_002228 [Hymenochirus boettgeri]